ncbi:ABC transporter permease [bacterium]|nr:ABC transporter permease [bacterium]
MKKTYYEPNHILNLGWGVWPMMIKELFQNRDLILRLMIRDFSAKYRQSLLGWLWAVLLPVINALVFTVIRRNIISISDTGIPYPVYVFWGTTLWQLFAQSLISSSNSLVVGANLVMKINIAKETLVLASFGVSLFDFFIRIILTVIVFFIFGVHLNIGMLLIPIVIVIPFLCLTTGLGLFLAMINALFRDITSMIPMLMAFMMLVTPGVIYPASQNFPMSLLKTLNPISIFMTSSQDIIKTGSVSNPFLLGIAIAVSVVSFLIFWYIFHVSEPRITERI